MPWKKKASMFLPVLPAHLIIRHQRYFKGDRGEKGITGFYFKIQFWDV